MDVYERYREGQRLLADASPEAAVEVLEPARDAEPEQSSIREALGRAYFRCRRFGAAEVEFAKAVELEPVNDYALFGLGLCRLRAGDQAGALGHLRLASAMRPDREEYRRALARAGEA